jgi:exopolyphosphatase/guanosine-5'-triphosphate,3'-diphosphate pyrophosphatase
MEGMVRGAVIDIGSNSIKMVVTETEVKELIILESLKNIVPIGRFVFLSGRIPQEITYQTVMILEKYSRILEEYAVDDIKVVATTAIREAKNRDIFIDTILRKTGFLLEILAVGDVVFYLNSYITHKLKDAYPILQNKVLIAEMGAGSIDVSIMNKGFTLLNMDLPIGTLRLKQLMNRLDGNTGENYTAVEEYVEREMSFLVRNLPDPVIDDIIVVDETYSPYLKKVMAGVGTDDKFYRIGKQHIEAIFKELRDKTVDEIELMFDIPSEIADRIIEYVLIVVHFLNLIKKDAIYIFEITLSEAILAERLLGLELSEIDSRTNQLISIARFLCKKYNVNIAHAEHVVGLCRVVFEKTRGLLGLDEKDLLYLILAAYLHDIGRYVHNQGHQRHTEYLLSFLKLFRMSDEEMHIVASISRYHEEDRVEYRWSFHENLEQNKRILVQKLSSILRITNSLDHSRRQKVKKLEVTVEPNREITLEVYTNHSFILERAELLSKKNFFEEITGNAITLVERALL